MAQEGRQDLWTYDAHADIASPADEYKFVHIGQDRVAALPGVGNAGKLSFILVEAHVGVASVVIGGVTKCILGAALDVGAKVTSNAAGLAVAAVAGDDICGVLLEAGDEDEMVAMLVAPGHIPE